MSSFKLKKISSGKRGKVIQTDQGTFVLGIYNPASTKDKEYSLWDSLCSAYLDPIYNDHEFLNESYFHNPKFDDYYTSAQFIDVRNPYQDIISIAQNDDSSVYTLINRTLSGITYLTNETSFYTQDQNTVVKYKDNISTVADYLELSSNFAILSGVSYNYFENIPLDQAYFDQNKGINFGSSFKLKNFYDWNFNVDMTTGVLEDSYNIENNRTYYRLGINNGDTWLAYKANRKLVAQMVSSASSSNSSHSSNSSSNSSSYSSSHSSSSYSSNSSHSSNSSSNSSRSSYGTGLSSSHSSNSSVSSNSSHSSSSSRSSASSMIPLTACQKCDPPPPDVVFIRFTHSVTHSRNPSYGEGFIPYIFRYTESFTLTKVPNDPLSWPPPYDCSWIWPAAHIVGPTEHFPSIVLTLNEDKSFELSITSDISIPWCRWYITPTERPIINCDPVGLIFLTYAGCLMPGSICITTLPDDTVIDNNSAIPIITLWPTTEIVN